MLGVGRTKKEGMSWYEHVREGAREVRPAIFPTSMVLDAMVLYLRPLGLGWGRRPRRMADAMFKTMASCMDGGAML